MKIGIMTFWWSEDNYGQILQCYALQKYLREQGHDAYLIRYDPRCDYIPTSFPQKLIKACNPVKLFSYLKNKVSQKKAIREQQQHPRGFSEFRDTHLVQSEKIYTSYQQLKNNPPDADMYVVGSDQVWNFSNVPVPYRRNLMRAYFLDFGKPETKRISYAASWGCEKIPKEYVTEITSLLQKFDYVSVRERAGVELCHQCGYENVDWVCDPTLLLSCADYSQLFSQEKIQNAYCVVYLLGNKTIIPMKQIQEYAKQRNLEIKYITSQNRFDHHAKRYPTIPQWLSLIAQAECIITNSFHGMVFSIIFNKNFVILPLVKHHAGMNTRVISLLQKLHIDGKIYKKSIEECVDKIIDWKSVATYIENEKMISL